MGERGQSNLPVRRRIAFSVIGFPAVVALVAAPVSVIATATEDRVGGDQLTLVSDPADSQLELVTIEADAGLDPARYTPAPAALVLAGVGLLALTRHRGS